MDADHDLLIRIDTKLDIFIQRQDELKKELTSSIVDVKEDLNKVKADVALLQKDIQSAKGFISGSKFVWAALGSLPPSIILLLLGIGDITK